MVKTFQEVIRDIKNGEVWVTCAYDNLEEIRRIGDRICFEFTPSRNGVNIGSTYPAKYKLEERKQYDFEEAWRAYEEGKEIESVEREHKYKKVLNEDYFCDADENIVACRERLNLTFTLDEIRGKWHIND